MQAFVALGLLLVMTVLRFIGAMVTALAFLLWIGTLFGLAGWILAVLAVIFGSIGLARAKVQGSFGHALTALILGIGLVPFPLVVLAITAAATTTG